MVSDIELIRFYRCDSLDELLGYANVVFQTIGLPLLSLSWTPAPGPDATMLKNFATVWDNYTQYFGQDGDSLKGELATSMSVALAEAGSNTKACQSWKTQRCGVFQVFNDAPEPYYLSDYQRQILQDYDHRTWSECYAIPICRERDRALILFAKSPSTVSGVHINLIAHVLETTANAYRFLYTKNQHDTDMLLGDRDGGVLSSREVECLQWLASGKTLTEAAIILGISERTLRYHVNNARSRLGVATTVQAVVAAALTYGFDPRDARRSICASSRPRTCGAP